MHIQREAVRPEPFERAYCIRLTSPRVPTQTDRMEKMLTEIHRRITATGPSLATEPGEEEKPRSTPASVSPDTEAYGEAVADEGASSGVEECVQGFQTHVLAMYPLIMPNELVGIQSLLYNTDKTGIPAKRKRSDAEAQQTGSQAAVALLVRALGEFSLAVCGTAKRRCAPGQDYVVKAVSLMESQQGDGSLDHIRANILVALYHGLFGRVLDSACYLKKAALVLKRLERSELRRPAGSSSDSVGVEENRFRFAYWTCLMMERYDRVPSFAAPANLSSDIRSVLKSFPEILTGFRHIEMPDPNAQLAGEQGLGNDVLFGFLGYVWLYRQKNRTPMGGTIDEIKIIEPLFDIPGGGLYTLLPNVSAARFRATYWDAKAAIYGPSIDHVLGNTAMKVDPEFVTYARKGIDALMNNIEALDDLPKGRPMMPNIFGLAHG